MQTLEQVEALLQLSQLPQVPDYESIQGDLARQKVSALEANNQALAKHIWCLENVGNAQRLFQQVYSVLQERDYYAAWCLLEQTELTTLRLYPHFRDSWRAYWLTFIQTRTQMLQSLYPYRLFISPEILELEKCCSICKKPISIRNPCGHRVGEIYDGEYCHRDVTQCKFLSISMVDDPVQKYSVPFLVDPNTGEKNDHYNYSVVEYLVKRWPSPFHDWRVEWTTALHPKEKFGQLGSNDKCPCESGNKYKDCCLERKGILRPHCEFIFNYQIAPELKTTELSY